MKTVMFISACIIAEAIKPGIVLNHWKSLPHWYQILIIIVWWLQFMFFEGPEKKLLRRLYDLNYTIKSGFKESQVLIREELRDIRSKMKG